MKDRLMHNFGLKLMSVFFAAILWLTITNVDDPAVTRTFREIPVEILNDDILISRGYSYSIESGETVDVRVKGKQSIVDTLSVSDFRASANFNSLSKSKMYMAAIDVSCLSPRAEELNITPLTENMAIKREEQETKAFTLQIKQNGSLKEGYYCYGTKVGANLIQATGSVTQIDAVKELVAYIDVDGKNASFTQTCDVVAYDMSGEKIDMKKITFTQDKVDVNVMICPTKTVSLQVITTGEPDVDYYAGIPVYAPETVLIAAEEIKLARISNIIVQCSVSGASEDISRKINLQEYIDSIYGVGNYYVPDNISVGTVVPIIPKEVRKLELTQDDVEIRNLALGLECTLHAMWNLTATVTGPSEMIETIEPADLKLYLDLKDCTVGTYSRPVLSDYQGDLKVDISSVMIKISPMAANRADDEGSEASENEK